jgi:cytidylate kinase
MSRGVVCISAADGAGGAEVARLVAERLGVRLIDEDLIQRAAVTAGVDVEVVADVERRRSLLERLIESVGSSSDAAAFALVGVPPVESAYDPLTGSDALRECIRTAIEEAASEGSLVIYAHAASVALAGRPEVLRVLVTAPERRRRKRIAEERDLNEDAAAKVVAQSDRGRADYLKRFYKVDAETPVLYDLVVNTERLEPADAAALVATAVAQRQAQPAAT